MACLWSPGLVFLSFPFLLLVSAATNHFDNQEGTRVKAAFLQVPPTSTRGGVEANLKAETHFRDSRVERRLALPRQTPPGLLMTLFGGLLLAIVIACSSLWERSMFGADRDSGKSGEEGFDLERWKELAGNGSLDFYTCMALSIGYYRTARSVLRFIPRLVVLACMQVLLVVLLVMHQARERHYFPGPQGHDYRIIGSLLFAYSAWNLYESMYDECRYGILLEMRKRHVSGWYCWPTILGEFVNMFVVTFLIISLYMIFCSSTQPVELLINCIAINFVADIDNRVVTEEDTEQAIEHLQEFSGHIGDSRRTSALVRSFTFTSMSSASSADSGDDAAAGTISDIVQVGVLCTNNLIRILVPVVAFILTLLFAVGNDKVLCLHMREIEPWPFCLGAGAQAISA